MSKKKFVIGVQIAVEALDLREAYGKVYESMNSIKPIVDWESTDTEWSDDDNFFDETEITEARSAYIAENS